MMRASFDSARRLLVVGCMRAGGGAGRRRRCDGWVVLGIDEYRALRARAFPTTPDPAPPPVDATLTRVDYDLRVNGDTVTGQARLAIDVLKQGWASVQVPAGMLVRDARIDGRPTPAQRDRRQSGARAALPHRPHRR